MKKKIKKYFDSGFWTEKMVADAVAKGKISESEFYEITGKKYS